MSTIYFRQDSGDELDRKEFGAIEIPIERVELVTRADHLPVILEAFERFLRGAGFCFDGKIEITNDFAEDKPESKPEDCDQFLSDKWQYLSDNPVPPNPS